MSITNIDKLKARYQNLKEKNKSYKDSIWKPKQGSTRIRILPYRYDKSDPFTSIYKYFGFNGKYFVSPASYGDHDPIVEAAKKIRSSGTKEDRDLAMKMMPRTRVMAYIVVRGQEDEGPKIWEFSNNVYEEILKYATDPDFGDIFDPVTGKDIVVSYTDKAHSDTNFAKTGILVKPNSVPIASDKDIAKKLINGQKRWEEIAKPADEEFLNEQLDKYLHPEQEDSDGDLQEEQLIDDVDDDDDIMSDIEDLLEED